jgi:hypothetical protein
MKDDFTFMTRQLLKLKSISHATGKRPPSTFLICFQKKKKLNIVNVSMRVKA